MAITRNTGTLTLQIVGIPASGDELPILMTGVFIRIRAHSGEEGAPPAGDERNDTSGPDGRVIFSDLPAGRYEHDVRSPEQARLRPLPLEDRR